MRLHMNRTKLMFVLEMCLFIFPFEKFNDKTGSQWPFSKMLQHLAK